MLVRTFALLARVFTIAAGFISVFLSATMLQHRLSQTKHI